MKGGVLPIENTKVTSCKRQRVLNIDLAVTL
jgi:hypothetical protein